MTRLGASVWFLFLLASLSCFGQSSSPGSSQSQGATPSSAPAPPQGSASSAPADAKNETRKKKVWTNEDVGTLNGPVSVVGSAKNPGKSGSDVKADPQYIANVKKQLEKLQSQLGDTNKELAALKDFRDGKPPAATGYPINKGYNRVPVDQQIAALEDKKKELEDKVGGLLDEARKKGVQPGDLR